MANLIGQNDSIDKIINTIGNLKSGNGKIYCIDGDTGFGKTTFLQAIQDRVSNENFNIIKIESNPPIGNLNIGNLQPLYPFVKAIEELKTNQHFNARQRLAMGVVRGVFSAVPVIGEFEYTLSKITDSFKLYRNEKSKTNQKNDDNLKVFLDSLRKFAVKKPLVILFDDAHWFDAHSVQLLDKLKTEIINMGIIIVLAYNNSILVQNANPLDSFLKNKSDSQNIEKIQLKLFSLAETQSLIEKSLNPYHHNVKLEQWIFEHSSGVPGIVAEYIKYIGEKNILDEKGVIKNDFEKDNFLPTTLSNVFSAGLNNLSEEEKNILAQCSAEGREFTVLIISKLLNNDILTTIRKLRAIQNKTGIIKSLNSQIKYGQQTTTYKFTQSYYYEYFENYLEKEEKVAVHSQIASYLKPIYDDTDSIELKEELVTYLAAHSLEAGDQSTAEEMLLISEETMKKYGTAELLRQLAKSDSIENSQNTEFPTDSDNEINNINEDSSNSDNNSVIKLNKIESDNDGSLDSNDDQITVAAALHHNLVDFKLLRKSIINDFSNSSYDLILNRIDNFGDYKDIISKSEQVQLLLLKSRSFLELKSKNSDSSTNNTELESKYLFRSLEALEEAKEIAEEEKDKFNLCLYYNALAIHHSEIKENDVSIEYLRKASKLSIKLPRELQLITITNIGLVLREMGNNIEAQRNLDAAKRLSRYLGFNSINELLSEVS